MRVAFVSPSFPPDLCGVGSYTARLSAALSEGGVETSVLTSINTDFHPLKIASIYARLKKDRPDILHLQFPTQNKLSSIEALLLFRTAKSLGIKTVITIHEHEPFYSKPSQLRNKLLAKSADRVVVNNLQSHSLLETKAFKSIVIHNGPTIENADGPSNRSDETVLTFFGFIAPHKRTLETLSAIKDLDFSDSVSVCIIGSFNPLDSYHILVKDLLGPKDKWLSDLSDTEVANEIKKSTLAILPFEHGVSEKNSTVISMLHLGVPVITSGPVPAVFRGAVIDAGKDLVEPWKRP
jgi:glycosyltransferase involved in cell wall biosynthesis